MPSQKQTILRMLQDAGDQGVGGNTFYANYLPRFPARIHELKAEGYRIKRVPAGDNEFTYILAAVPQGVRPAVVAGATLDTSPQITIGPGGRSASPGSSLPVGEAEPSCSSSESVEGPCDPVPLFELAVNRYEDAA